MIRFLHFLVDIALEETDDNVKLQVDLVRFVILSVGQVLLHFIKALHYPLKLNIRYWILNVSVCPLLLLDPILLFSHDIVFLVVQKH